MATFVNRESPSQAAVYRIIDGSIRNASHAHPDWVIDHRFRNSVAKRAAGTLSAQFLEVLAAKPSEEPDSLLSGSSGEKSSYVRRRQDRRDYPSQSLRSLLKVHRAIGRLVYAARRTNPELEQTLIEVLRIVGAEIKRIDGVIK